MTNQIEYVLTAFLLSPTGNEDFLVSKQMEFYRKQSVV